MGTLKTFLDSKGITPKHLVVASNRLEAWGNDGRYMISRRAAKRRAKDEKPYAELGLTKPVSGRGLSEQQVSAALADQPLPRKVRAKVLRAVNAVLATKKQGAVELKALFEGTTMKKGKAPKAAKAAAEKKK